MSGAPNFARKGYVVGRRSPLGRRWIPRLRRAYRAFARVGLGVWAYRGMVAALRVAAAAPFVGAERDLLAESVWTFLHGTPLVPPHRHRRVLREAVVVDHLAALFGRGLEILADRDFDRIVQVRGREHLDAARSAGRPVVLLHLHCRFARLFWTLMRRWWGDEGYLIVPTSRPDGSGERPPHDPFQAAVGMRRALAVLREGGVVHILPDARQGSRFVEVPFAGRTRRFPLGFVALALTSNAVILPVSSIVRADGRALVTIEPPLDRAGVSSLETCRPWVEAYARFLEGVWRNHPSNLVHGGGHLANYLQLPRTDLPAVGADGTK